MLITRVANVDITWHKDVATSPRISHEFDLTLEDKSVLRAIEQLNFIQMKRKWNFKMLYYDVCFVLNVIYDVVH